MTTNPHHVNHPTTVCQLTLPPHPESIDAIHDLVAALWAQNPQLSDPDKGRFELGVIEVASNIIEDMRRAPPDAPQVNIVVTLTADPQEITARFCDEGRATDIDLSAVDMPDEMAERGRGLALTQAMLDDLTYERSGSTNIWTLTCVRAAPKGSAR